MHGSIQEHENARYHSQQVWDKKLSSVTKGSKTPIRNTEAGLLLQRQLIKRGAEADIYLTVWGGKKAISKVRSPKPYRNRSLDSAIRKHRTIHEAKFISDAKSAGVLSPFIYFVDPVNAEIIMEFIEGRNVRETVTPALCSRIGRYAGMLHAVNIIHGDLTTSNFIVNRNRLVIIDFGLAFYSERTEDAATDVRLIKAVFASAHVKVTHAFDHFIAGYSNVLGEKKTKMVLRNVAEIEQRGRYARVT